MRVLLSVMFCLVCTFAQAEVLLVRQVRDLYYKANENKKAAERFYNTMQAMADNEQPLFAGYRGVATMMRAKYGIDPFYKLSCFNRGKALLEQAIEQDPQNVELRFLRYCVQCQVPRILMYYDALGADKSAILRALPQLKDDDLRQRIKDYVLNYSNDKELYAAMR